MANAWVQGVMKCLDVSEDRATEIDDYARTTGWYASFDSSEATWAEMKKFYKQVESEMGVSK
jgi:hypothetical protein